MLHGSLLGVKQLETQGLGSEGRDLIPEEGNKEAGNQVPRGIVKELGMFNLEKRNLVNLQCKMAQGP